MPCNYIECELLKVYAYFVNFFWRWISIAAKGHSINEDIREKEVRVVDADGSQLGIMTSDNAQKMADAKNLDLVMIAPQGVPPVCRIMDYGKFKFEQQKREKDARKNQKVVDIKEIRMSLNIGQHDLDTKVSHATKFLKEGDKVKATIRFRGRERAHASMGTVLLNRFAEACSEFGVVEKEPKFEGRGMQMFLAPKNNKQ